MSLRSRTRRLRRMAVGALREQPPPEPAPAPEAADGAGDPVADVASRDQADVANMRRLLAFTLHRDSCCIDVGAHRGAVLAEMVRVAPAGRHIAFEPIPALCELLQQEFPQVEVHQAALSNHSGESSFAHVQGSAEGWSGLRFRPLPGGAQAEVQRIDVSLEVLDDVLDPQYRPSVIKIDVEGAEEQVLRGAIRTLRRHHPTLILEHGSGSAETYGTSPTDIHSLLDDVGYRIFDLDGNGPYTLAQLEQAFYTAERVNFVAHP